MVTIRADSDDTGVPPVAAFFAGVVVAAAVGYGAFHERPELFCPAPPPTPELVCPDVQCPPCLAAAQPTPVTPAPPEPPPMPAPTRGDITGPAIVNVWLERCRDCMPAFSAWRDLKENGQLPSGAPIYNVVYGSQTATLNDFAARYGVADNISFDAGDRYVQPLGIGTFTTLVLDSRGQILAQIRPTDADFVRQLSAAWGAANAMR